MLLFFRSYFGKVILLSITASLFILMTSCIKRPVVIPKPNTVTQADIIQEPQEKIPPPQLSSKIDTSLTVPATKKEYSKRGAPLTNFVSANFVGSHHCAKCHEDLKDSAGNDVSISGHWRSTMMANAAKDPLWQAKVKSEVQRNPALAKIIEKKCVSCHMPMAWIQAGVQKKQYKLRGVNSILDAFLDPNSKLHEAAMDGVSCSFCHQIQDDNLGTPDSFSGEFTIDTKTVSPHRPIYGPYRDVYQETMISTVGYTPMYGPQKNDSALCAICHTLYTPYVDAAGNIKGEFPEQTVYLEWLHSDYGEPAGNRHDIGEVKGKIRLCQDCHMPHSEAGGVIIANPAHKNVQKKDHFSRHHFAGGNALMLNILHDQVVPIKVSASTKQIKDTGKRTAEQLQMNSARLFIRDTSHFRNQLTIDLEIDNRVGHKFPTGFPSRRTWIHLLVEDGTGATIFESGKPLVDGRIAGDNSDEMTGYEPHYDTITDPEQVQIYESVMVNTDNEVTYTLMRAAGYIKDNRLLPYGFNKRSASTDIKVYGHAEQDRNFKAGTDEITYRVNTDKSSGPYTVTARLLYTPVSFAFAKDLRRDEHLPLVKRFRHYYDKTDKSPVTVAVAQEIKK
jgi:hypothetical protein